MSLLPIRTTSSLDPVDRWDVTPYSSWDRQDLVDPFANVSRDLVTPDLAPALARSRQTINTFSPLLAADIIESANDFHVHVSYVIVY